MKKGTRRPPWVCCAAPRWVNAPHWETLPVGGGLLVEMWSESGLQLLKAPPMTHTLISSLARLLGRDAHIEPAGPAWAFLDFDHVNHGGGEREVWGLGLHLVMSPRSAARSAA